MIVFKTLGGEACVEQTRQVGHLIYRQHQRGFTPRAMTAGLLTALAALSRNGFRCNRESGNEW